MKSYVVSIVSFLLIIVTCCLMFSSRVSARYVIRLDNSIRVSVSILSSDEPVSFSTTKHQMFNLQEIDSWSTLLNENIPTSLDTTIKKKRPSAIKKKRVEKEYSEPVKEESNTDKEPSFAESCMADCLSAIIEGMCASIFGGNEDKEVVTETQVEITKPLVVGKPTKPLRELPYKGVIIAFRYNIKSIPIVAQPVKKSEKGMEVGAVPVGTEVKVNRIMVVDDKLWAKVAVTDSTGAEGWVEEKYIKPISKTESKLEKDRNEQPYHLESIEKPRLEVEEKKERERVVKEPELQPKPINRQKWEFEESPSEEFKEKSIPKVKKENVPDKASVEDSVKSPLGINIFLSATFPLFARTSLYKEYNKSDKFKMNFNLGTRIPIYRFLNLGLDVGYCFANGTPRYDYEYGANMKDSPLDSDLNIFYFGPTLCIARVNNGKEIGYIGLGPIYSNVRESAEIAVYKGDTQVGSKVDKINRWQFGGQFVVHGGSITGSNTIVGLELRFIILSWEKFEQKSLTLDFLDRGFISFFTLGFYFGYSF